MSTVQTVTEYTGEVPSRTAPLNFPANADSFVTWLAAFARQLIATVASMNTVAGEVNANATAAATSAATATTQAALATTNGAAQVALAAAQASLATTNGAVQVALATAQAATAQSYALQAQVAAPPAWDAVTSFTFPQVSVGSDGNTYRCLGTGVVNDNPINRSANWLLLTNNAVPPSAMIYQFENCGGF